VSSQAQQVLGQDIIKLYASSCVAGTLMAFFLAVAQMAPAKLNLSYPDIQITFSYSPQFRPLIDAEDQAIIKQINDAGVNVLFVGIG